MTSTPTTFTGKPLRYIVSFRHLPHEATVSYNTRLDNSGLGKRASWDFALHTASTYGGRLEEEFADGRIHTLRDWSGGSGSHKPERPPSERSPAESPEETAELG